MAGPVCAMFVQNHLQKKAVLTGIQKWYTRGRNFNAIFVIRNSEAISLGRNMPEDYMRIQQQILHVVNVQKYLLLNQANKDIFNQHIKVQNSNVKCV